jgi:hypothetical protein
MYIAYCVFIVYLPSDFIWFFSFSLAKLSIQMAASSNLKIINNIFLSLLYLIIVQNSDPGNVLEVFWSCYLQLSTESINIIEVQESPNFVLAKGLQRPIAPIDVCRDLQNQFLWLESRRGRQYWYPQILSCFSKWSYGVAKIEKYLLISYL